MIMGWGREVHKKRKRRRAGRRNKRRRCWRRRMLAALAFAMHMCFAPCTFRTLFISDIIQFPTSQAKAMSDQPDGPLDGRS